MDREDEDSMSIDQEIVTKDLVICLPMLSESDIEMMIHGAGDSSQSYVSSSNDENDDDDDDEEKHKPCLKRDQQRISLLNNPDYGIVLSFIDKFRSHINFKKYPLRIFEDNLLSEQDKISARFIDFHIHLLKKATGGRITARTQFIPNMIKFAYRFNRYDGAQLEEHGYAKINVDTKVRILKNLLEQQLDRNQSLQRAITDQSKIDLHSKPIGRDRLGASYWIFSDRDCFMRLFREYIDEKRAWTNVAKNADELQSMIEMLISDSVIQKKFPNWKLKCECFNNLTSSNKFEEEYSSNYFLHSNPIQVKGSDSPMSIVLGSTSIKAENINLDPIVNLDRAVPPTTSSSSSSSLKSRPVAKKIIESSSDNESISSDIITGKQQALSSSSPSSSSESSDVIANQRVSTIQTVVHQRLRIPSSPSALTSPPTRHSSDQAPILTSSRPRESSSDHESIGSQIITGKSAVTSSSSSSDVSDEVFAYDLPSNTTEQIVEPMQVISLIQGIKRKLVDYDDSESDSESESKIEQQTPKSKADKRSKMKTTEQPIALRRSRRSCRSLFVSNSQDSSSAISRSLSDVSTRQTRDNYRRSKTANQTRRCRRRNRKQKYSSTTTSDEHQQSDDDLFDEYTLQKNTALDSLLDGDLVEEHDPNYVPPRSARTVAQCPTESKPCFRCLQTNRLESLVLCDSCNDAYHLECLQPELISLPDEPWDCPLCEHKKLCESLIEKYKELVQEEKQFEVKRRISIAKRRKRLTSVTVNLERSDEIEQIIRPMKTKRFISSDEEPVEVKKRSNRIIEDDNDDDDDDDGDSVYGKKNDENRKPSDEENQIETDGKRRVRSCRKKQTNYSLDDYDKKIKKAIVDAGVHKDLTDSDSNNSDEVLSSKKRSRYEEDEDFEGVKSKQKTDSLTSRRRRTVNSDTRNGNDDSRPMIEDSRSDGRDFDDFDDYGMSDDDTAWRNRRPSSGSSTSKNKSKTKSTINHKKFIIPSDDDTISYDPDDSNLTSAENLSNPVKVKSEPASEYPGNIFGRTEIVKNIYDKNRIIENVVYTSEAASIINKPRRSTVQRKTPAKKKKKPTIADEQSQQEPNDNEKTPKKRAQRRKRLGSNDSSPNNDDDDYELAVNKQKLFTQGKNTTRTSITGHIKKLLGQDDDDDEDEDEEEEEDEENDGEKTENGGEIIKEKKKKSDKKKISQHDEYQISDDDDFPDPQEILKTTGLNLKQPLPPTKEIPFRTPYMSTIQSYQFAMVDPTAQFEFTCPTDDPITEPSDSSQINGDINSSTTT